MRTHIEYDDFGAYEENLEDVTESDMIIKKERNCDE